MGGSAIIAAAEKLKEAIRTAAAVRLNCAAENIVLDAGLAKSSDGNGSAEPSSHRRICNLTAHSRTINIPTIMARTSPMSRSTRGQDTLRWSIMSQWEMWVASSIQ